MRKFAGWFFVGGLALAVGAPVAAQEAPPFVSVGVVELAPGDAEEFAAQVKIVRDAAVAANLDARFAWDLYRWDNTFWFVSWPESLARLENPEAMFAAFAETDQAETAMAAFQRVAALEWLSDEQSISRTRPDLSYLPAQPAMAEGEQGGVYIIEQWPRMETSEAFEESVKDLMGMLTEMGAPYPVYVAQDLIGDAGVVFAVAFDDLASFYGESSLEAALAEAGMTEAWMAHAEAHQDLIRRAKSQILMYMPEHSYTPAGGM